MNIQSLKILSFLIMAAFTPMGAFGACSGTQWTRFVGYTGGEGWGCNCSESNKNYNISRKCNGTKSLYSSSTLCGFPQYTECSGAGGCSATSKTGNWGSCGGIWIIDSPDNTISTLPANAFSTATNSGWKWSCNSGFNWDVGKKKCLKPCAANEFRKADDSCGKCGEGEKPNSAGTGCESAGTGGNTGSTGNTGNTGNNTNGNNNGTPPPSTPPAPSRTIFKIPGSQFLTCGANSSSQLDFESCLFSGAKTETTGGLAATAEVTWAAPATATVMHAEPAATWVLAEHAEPIGSGFVLDAAALRDAMQNALK